jgi:hypothetical protein
VSTGYGIRGVCWSSADLAAQALCDSYPVTYSAGSNVTFLYCTGYAAGGGSLTLKGQTCSSASCGAFNPSYTQTTAFASCERDITTGPFNLSVADGTAVGVAIAGVWFAAWAWRTYRKVLGGVGADAEG